MKKRITKINSFLIVAILLCLSIFAKAETIVGWDFTSLNSTLGTTGITLSSVQTNPSPTQTQTLSGGLYGSFKTMAKYKK